MRYLSPPHSGIVTLVQVLGKRAKKPPPQKRGRKPPAGENNDLEGAKDKWLAKKARSSLAHKAYEHTVVHSDSHPSAFSPGGGGAHAESQGS